MGKAPLGRRKISRHRDTLIPNRVPITWPAKVLPSTWRGPVQNQFVTKMIGTGPEYLLTAPPYGQVWHKAFFLDGTGRRAVAHTRPEFPKMPTAPSAFPLLGVPQAPGDIPNLPEGSKSLGGRPPEAVGNPQEPRHTLPELRPDNRAGQSATQHLERSISEINLSPK